MAITDHEMRFKLSNELHARPFSSISAPAHVAFLALTFGPRGAVGARDDLELLLNRHGLTPPGDDQKHYSGLLGRTKLKWELHSEFASYMLVEEGADAAPFTQSALSQFPQDWVAACTAERLVSVSVSVLPSETDDAISKHIRKYYVGESVAAVQVLDEQLVVCSDFRIDKLGDTRISVFARAGVGTARIGRVVQRLCEIETYKTLSMLGFDAASTLREPLAQSETSLTDITSQMAEAQVPAETLLAKLLSESARLERMSARVNYRFGATEAYARIVSQRVEALRESRFLGRQLLSEFMMRRFDPAVHTVEHTQRRLVRLRDRAVRAADLLRTQLEVQRSRENQEILQSMDRRADLQLRLQQTVEGLSVVAISYYAVSLGGYALAPLAKEIGIEKPWLYAGLTPIVVLLVWWMVRRIRAKFH